jgi:hypothetical protein
MLIAPSRLLRVATLLAVVALSNPLAAQNTTPDTASVRRDTLAAQRLQVSLLTFGPGTPVFERFGHNALRIADPLLGFDIAWNWGMFSFDEPNFLARATGWLASRRCPCSPTIRRATGRQSSKCST